MRFHNLQETIITQTLRVKPTELSSPSGCHNLQLNNTFCAGTNLAFGPSATNSSDRHTPRTRLRESALALAMIKANHAFSPDHDSPRMDSYVQRYIRIPCALLTTNQPLITLSPKPHTSAGNRSYALESHWRCSSARRQHPYWPAELPVLAVAPYLSCCSRGKVGRRRY